MGKIQDTGAGLLAAGAAIPILEYGMHGHGVGWIIGAGIGYGVYSHLSSKKNKTEEDEVETPHPPSVSHVPRKEVRDNMMYRLLIGKSARGEVAEEGQTRSPLREAEEAAMEGGILMGKSRRGPVLKSLSDLKNMLILGLPGQGKSSLACWLLSQMITQYDAQLIILDRHARDDESLSAMLSPFESRFLLPPAYRFEQMEKSIEEASTILDDRMEKRDPSKRPVIFVCDEFTDLMRSKKVDGLEDTVESYNALGRKFGCFSLCIGQLTNASRTGGTEIRELFATKMLLQMAKSQAKMVVDIESAALVDRLEIGQYLFAGEGRDEPFVISFEKKGPGYYNAQASLLKPEPARERNTDELDNDDEEDDSVSRTAYRVEAENGNSETVRDTRSYPDGWNEHDATLAQMIYKNLRNKDQTLKAIGKTTTPDNRRSLTAILQEDEQ